MYKRLTTGELAQQRDALLARLHALPNLMRGSVYERPRKCGRATCACAGAGPKHTTRQLTVTLDRMSPDMRKCAILDWRRLITTSTWSGQPSG